MRITPVVPSLMDPRLRRAIPMAWPSLCSIQTILTTTSASYQETPSGGSDIVGLQEIPCRLEPLTQGRGSISDDLQRGGVVQEYHIKRHLDLNGYFPQIVADGSMQAVVNGETFPIRGVDSDGQRYITRLRLEVVNPHA